MTPANLCEEVYVSLIDEGSNLFTQGNFKAAERCFWQAFQLRPGAPIVLFNLGRVMEEVKDSRAIDFYEAAATQGNVDASYQLAKIYTPNPHFKQDAIRHLNLFLKNSGNKDEFGRWAQTTLDQLSPISPKLKLSGIKESEWYNERTDKN